MDAALALEALLGELAVSFQKEEQEEGVIRYDLSPDSADGEMLTGILYPTEAGHYLRLMVYIDELQQDGALVMLKELMAMNGELPTGAYCMDPDEELIYATVNIPMEGLVAQPLAEAIEVLFMAQDLFDETFFPENGGGDAVSTPTAQA
ncbi:hypothetical protein IT575_08870 [bacterium]|nr:hypothetical protein [bacterium]